MRLWRPNLLPLDEKSGHTLLVVKLSALGDVIHALPAVHALKTRYPWLPISWVVEDRCAPILYRCPHLKEVIVFPRQTIKFLWEKGEKGKALSHLWEFLKGLRARKFSHSIDLQGLAKSALMVMAAGAKERIACTGLKEGSSLITRSVPEGEGIHAVERNLKVAEFLGAGVKEAYFPIILQEEEKDRAEALLCGDEEKKPLVGLHLGASLPQKTWSFGKWQELIGELQHQEKGLGLVLLGLERDRDLAENLMAGAEDPLIDLTGKTGLFELAAVLSLLRVLVSGDSGPLHIAAALGIPVVGLYGPDHPRFTGPYTGRGVVIQKGLSCSPCYKRPSCAAPYPCMEAISAGEVLEAVKNFLYGY